MEAAAGDDFDIGASEMVPAAQLSEGDAKSVGDGYESVAAAGSVEDHAGGGSGRGGLGNDQSVEALEGAAGVKLVGLGEFRLGDMKFVGDGGQGIIGSQAMVAPGVSLCFGDEGDALLEEGGGSGWEMQVEGCVGRRDHAQEAGVESSELVDGGIDQVRDEAEVDGVIDGDGVSEDRGIVGDIVEAVLGGVVGNDDGGEDFRDVVLGFAGKVVAFVELPVVGVAGFLDGLLNSACAPVVGGHGEVPVAELVVDELHVAGIGAGGFFWIEALVDVVGFGEPVELVVGHELPHATGAGTAVLGAGLEARFGDGEIDEVLGDAFFSEDALDHCLVAAGALDGMQECIVALLGLREELEECADVVVDDEGEIGLGGGELSAGLGDDGRVSLKRDVAGNIGGGFLFRGDEAVALLEGFHLKGVYSVDDVNELVLELGVGLDGD